ncbi:MAG: hypothetical protein APR63_14250 [Desulfuromonas sp. SDB]|nr:MAG: hypothetical protein APR63_14250 [Desulfuromonas sp. SDB]
MIKICYIIPNLVYGGAERYIIEILKYFLLNKFPVELYLLIIKPNSEKDLLQEIPRSIKIKTLNFKSFKFISSLLEINKAYKFVKSNNIDIIHSNLNLADFISCLIKKRCPHLKLISTEHNTNQFRIKTYKSDIISRYKDLYRLKYTDKVIAISKSVRNYLLDHTNYSPDKVDIIYHGVDIKKFNATKYKRIILSDNNIINVALIGRMVEQKGHLFLLNILSKLNKNIIEKYHFYFAGDGIFRSSIENKIRDYRLNNNITILGNINWIPRLIYNVDAVIMPSRWEGFGIVAIEAGACKKPVIASNIDGLREIVIHNQTGYLIDPTNEYKWISLFMNISKQQLFKMGLQAYKRIIKHFSMDKMMNETFKIYQEIKYKDGY